MADASDNYRILLPVDGRTDRAKRGAQAVTELPGETSALDVVILNVFEEFSGTDEGAVVESSDLFDEDNFPKSVTVAAEILEEAGATVECRREHGDPAETILSVADDIDANCLVMVGRQRSPTGKVLFGSVVQSVILESDRPVLTSFPD